AARGALRGEGRLALIDPEDQRIVIRGVDVRHAGGDRWEVMPPPGSNRIQIDRTTAEGAFRNQIAERVTLRVAADSTRESTSFGVDLENVQTPELNNASAGSLTLERLRMSTEVAGEVFKSDPESLLEEAQRLIDAAPNSYWAGELARDRRNLIQRRDRISGDARGNMHERTGLAAACFVMTLAGAVMALRLRESMPLTIYLWSFFPALGTIITVSGGSNVMRENEALGLVVVWSGIAGLAAYTIFAYLRLARR
ncbi:MAG: hypothetical protein VYC34_04970, partial [Planctomycetota bacterium]|nr:hypothetical protein [Planctomycetota bacterium]